MGSRGEAKGWHACLALQALQQVSLLSGLNYIVALPQQEGTGRACTFLVCVQIHILVCIHKLKFGAFFFFLIKIFIDLLNLEFLSYEIQGDLKSKFL